MVTRTRYHDKTDAELAYIAKDAFEAANAMKSIGNDAAECKYLDQLNDASTEQALRAVQRMKMMKRKPS